MVDDHMTITTDESVSDTIKDMYFIFEVDGEDYGIEIANVVSIIEMKNITRVPQMPYYIEGILNLRGDLIGVLNVRKRFRKPPKEYDHNTCIVVIHYSDYTLGFIVDSVKTTQIILPENVSPPPNAKLNNYNQFIRNIGKVSGDIKLLLDLERFLAHD